ncbi:hypothetical protein C0J52_01453, partial [Blattella germanica]
FTFLPYIIVFTLWSIILTSFQKDWPLYAGKFKNGSETCCIVFIAVSRHKIFSFKVKILQKLIQGYLG